MATIKPKVKSDIRTGITYRYIPGDFAQHKLSNFIEVDDPQIILDNIKPLEVFGRRIIFFDTETHPYFNSSHDLPRHIVRRWVDSGKKAKPQDFPFCMQIFDGKKAFAIYDTIDNGFAKFKALAPIFEDPTVEKCAHNIKFDMHMIQNIGMKIVGKIHDTVIIAKLVNENRDSFKLRDIAATYKGIIKFEYMVDAFKKEHKIGDYRWIPRELLTQYGCADVFNCAKVFINEFPMLEQDDMLPLYETEMKNTIALYAMERYGMRVDKEYEEPLKNDLSTMVDKSEREVYRQAGQIFNMNSGQQLYRVLMQLGVDPKAIKSTDKGNPKLDKKALEYLADVHNVEIVKAILTFRQNEKLFSTYAVGIYDQADSCNRVHGSINQTEATTGRMSIVQPALQTLPKKNKVIRRCFIPEDDYLLWFLDLDQVEYRFFAHYARALSLIELIKQGYDVHTATASLLFNVPYHEVTEDQRQKAKTMNFALIYGMGKEALARALGMTMAEAEIFKARYFAAIPEALPFIRDVQQVTKVRGYIRNYYGRRRRLDYDEVYKAVNALIQGCAADYLKRKIAMIYAFLRSNNYKTRMEIVVHDELVHGVHKTEEHILPKLRWLFSDFDTFRAPITAGIDYGEPSWGQKKEAEMEFTPLTDDELKRVEEFDFFDGHVFNNDLYAA